MIRPNELFKKEIIEYSVCGENYVNLDNGATTPPLKEVQDRLDGFLNSYGSVHRGSGAKSIASTETYEDARRTILSCVNAPKDSYVVYSQNTTGAVNLLASLFSRISGKIAVSDIEHSSSSLPFIVQEGYAKYKPLKLARCREFSYEINEKIQKKGHSQVVRYPVDNLGNVDFSALKKLLKKYKIKALMLTASANLTGVQTDVMQVARLIRQVSPQTFLIVDVCQYIPHHLVDMQSLGADFIVASGHKFYAPYGGGFIVGPKQFFDMFMPYQIGGGNLPYIDLNDHFYRYRNNLAFDPGTPNAVGVVSMAVALNKLREIGYENIESYEKDLVEYAYDRLKDCQNIELYVDREHLGSVITFNIKNKNPQVVAQILNCKFAIGVRAGAFCVYRYVNRLLGVTDDSKIRKAVEMYDTSLIEGVIRASVSLQNTKDDMKRFADAVLAIAEDRLSE